MTAGLEVSPPEVRSGILEANRSPGDALVLENRGWSSREVDCAPKLAALASLARLAPPEPVGSVGYVSRGNALVAAGAQIERARAAAETLSASLHVTLIAAKAAPSQRFTAWSAAIESLEGYLGEFTATVSGLQGSASAAQAARFDLVLDFCAEPLFAMRQPPQGYFRAPAEDAALAEVLAEMRDAVGDFEKPRYFGYRENLCAHSRSDITGCNRCIDICSTRAIASDGDHVKVDPHLCMGCGACATVCPSGALSFQFPRVAERGMQMKQLLGAYASAGGKDACIVFHDGQDGREMLAAAAASGKGLPARALPLETWHVAAIGLDLLLPAIAFGASQAVVFAAAGTDREYLQALRRQMKTGEEILSALGYAGTHFAVIEPGDARLVESAFDSLGPAASPTTPAVFMLGNDKRTAIEFAVEHLSRHAPTPVDEIPLTPGAPFGQIAVNASKCTMCMACVGACPSSALMDGVEQPLLKFLERNCVQCGLCSATCPEGAITLSARLLLTPAVRDARVLNETQPFHCVRCNKPFGTRQMVEAMLGRLTGHSMFTAEGALRRLQMCADCRVVDMMSTKDEMSVLKMGSGS